MIDRTFVKGVSESLVMSCHWRSSNPFILANFFDHTRFRWNMIFKNSGGIDENSVRRKWISLTQRVLVVIVHSSCDIQDFQKIVVRPDPGSLLPWRLAVGCPRWAARLYHYWILLSLACSNYVRKILQVDRLETRIATNRHGNFQGAKSAGCHHRVLQPVFAT